MAGFINSVSSTLRNLENYEEPHVSPVTPAKDLRTIMINRVSWGAALAAWFGGWVGIVKPAITVDSAQRRQFH